MNNTCAYIDIKQIKKEMRAVIKKHGTDYEAKHCEFDKIILKHLGDKYIKQLYKNHCHY